MKHEVETMKKTGKILVIGITSILLLSGMLGASATVNGGEPEGCTPGFWKNLRKHGDEWTDYSPTDSVGGIFTLPSEFSSLDVSLIDALKFGGGDGKIGMARNLIRAAVAGILNEAHPNINYPEYNVIGQVNTALANAAAESDVEIARDIMETLKDTLDAANNLGSDVCC